MEREKFSISLNKEQFEVATPLLKGHGNIRFQVSENNRPLVTIEPLLKANKIVWCATQGINCAVNNKKIQAIGKEIEKHYS